MAVRDILLLGDNRLYDVSRDVLNEERQEVKAIVSDLHDTIMEFRRQHGFGRAIAAPQIGVFKRLIYMHIDLPVVIINPILTFDDEEMIEVCDNCMSFPNLMVRVRRHRRCRIEFRDDEWNLHTENHEGDMAELLQHECDHLDGILAVQRAIDGKSLALRNRKKA